MIYCLHCWISPFWAGFAIHLSPMQLGEHFRLNIAFIPYTVGWALVGLSVALGSGSLAYTHLAQFFFHTMLFNKRIYVKMPQKHCINDVMLCPVASIYSINPELSCHAHVSLVPIDKFIQKKKLYSTQSFCLVSKWPIASDSAKNSTMAALF